MNLSIRNTTNRKLLGSLKVPGDKSISHRALIFATFCQGTSYIEGLSPAEDCRSTANCLSELSINIEINCAQPTRPSVKVVSNGLGACAAPKNTLFAGNSGTTIRLLSGLLAGRPFTSHLDGDQSLRQRPMARILDHLETMGAKVTYSHIKGLAPFSISGGNLQGKDFKLNVASAQVQTALLLAGLQAEGRTTVQLPGIARDHTTCMFSYMGIPYELKEKNIVSVTALKEAIPPFNYLVPGDISSAAFFMVAAACLPNSNILLTNIGVNPGRTLVIDVLKKMGADIELLNPRQSGGEEVADIAVKGHERLKGVTIAGNDIARGVDELPVLALAGSLCHGEFVVKDAAELRHKESDRLQLICTNLKAAGADIQELEDGFVILGKKKISGGSVWQTKLDHRLAMSGLIADLLFEKQLDIEETASSAVSYPNFAQDLESLLDGGLRS